MAQKIYVDEIVNIETDLQKQELQVKIRGNLPSPAYTFDRFDVKVQDKTIEITPLAKYDPDKMVTQVLVPYEQICRIERVKPGDYELKVHGRSDTVTKQQIKVE